MSTRGRSKLRRILTRATTFLFAGAIINILIAWACAAWIPDTYSIGAWGERASRGRSEADWPCSVPKDWPRRPERVMTFGDPGYLDSLAYAVSADGIGLEYSQTSFWYGLPLPSMVAIDAHRIRLTDRGLFHTTEELARDVCGCPMPAWFSPVERDRLLPIRPVALGFVTNTFIYASLLGVLAWLPLAGRATRRKLARGEISRRGLRLRLMVAACVFLVFGTLATVAIAWSLVIWSPPRVSIVGPASSFPRPTPPSWPAAAEQAKTMTWGYTYIITSAPTINGVQYSQTFAEAGWPLRCLWSSSNWGGKLTSPATRAWRDGFYPPEWLRDNSSWVPVPRILPTQVDPIRFAIDALLLAGILATPGLLRLPSILRALRGPFECVTCAYDLRGVPSSPDGTLRCPECGEVAR